MRETLRMGFVQIIVLSLVQGLTEFLPVSSSAHLILGGKLFGWSDQGLVFDVATHLGTLIAVLLYFRRDLLGMFHSALRPAEGAKDRAQRHLLMCLGIASLPALVVGFAASALVEHYLRDVRIIAWTTIGFGLLLWLADAVGGRSRTLHDVGWKSALLIGLAQAFALIPGASRSGVTITAGRFLGLGPEAAARFSFLLAVPVVAAAGGYGAARVAAGDAPIDWLQFSIAVLVSALAGWGCIAAFLALLRRVGLLPFVIYRLILGAVLLWLIA